MPNEWGLYDMHGNVWEWCLDWEYDLSRNVVDPVGPSSPRRDAVVASRVLRGGGWDSRAGDCRSAFRNSGAPGYILPTFGFGSSDLSHYYYGNRGFRLCCSAGPRE